MDSLKDQKEDLQRKITIKLHEESLLPPRLLVFLMTSSILFLALVQLAQVPGSRVAMALSIVGFITCVIAFIHGRRVKDQMDKIDDILRTTDELKQNYIDILGIEKPHSVKSLVTGRWIFLWLNMVFGGLWGFSIWHSFYSCGEWRFWTFGPPAGFLIIWLIWEHRKSLKSLLKKSKEPIATQKP